jgi:Acyltransferase family
LTESKHNALVDYARFLGAIAIIYFHLKLPSGQYGLTALSMFTTLAFYYLSSSTGGVSLGDSTLLRAKRIMIPWLVWSIIYGLLKVLDTWAYPHPLAEEFSWWMLLTGTAIHLWFLPYLFLSGTLALGVFKFIDLSKLSILALSAAYVVLCLLASFVLQQGKVGVPFVQWLSVLPASVLGIVLSTRPLNSSHFLGFSALSFLTFAFQLSSGLTAGSIQLLISSLISIAALSFTLSRTPFSRDLAKSSLGVYLVHPLVASLLTRVVGLENQSLLLMTMTTAASLFLAIILSRTPILRASV